MSDIITSDFISRLACMGTSINQFIEVPINIMNAFGMRTAEFFSNYSA